MAPTPRAPRRRPYPPGAHTQTTGRHEGQQRPDGRGGQYEETEAEQDPSGDRRVPHVTATGAERWPEVLGGAGGGRSRTAPEKEHERQEEERDGVEGEHRGDAEARDHEAGHGGPYRTRDVHADARECGRGRQLRTGHEFGNERLVRRGRHCAGGAEHEGEAEKKRGRHLAGKRECSEAGTGRYLEYLQPDEKAAPIEDVGQCAAGEGEEQVGQGVGGLDQRHQGRSVGQVDEQPLCADRLHPGADVAGQDRQPERPEHVTPERGPGRPDLDSGC